MKAVYSSTHDDVLKTWSRNEAGLKQFGKECDELRSKSPIPGLDPVYMSGGFTPNRWVIGFDTPDDYQHIEGWRIDRDGYLVPDKRTKIGRAIKFPSFSYESLPGICEFVTSDSHWHRPLPNLIDGVVWMGWTIDPETANHFEIDRGMWNRRLMSDYWLAVESEQP